VPANVQDGNVQLAQKSNDDVTSMFDTGTAYPRQSTPVPQALPDEEAVTYIERLLAAIDRLRGERDGLRRDVQFLETESKFAVEALEAKLAQTITTDGRSVALKDEVDNLRIQLDRAMTREEDFAGRAEGQVRRFGLATAAFAVVVGHLQFQTDAVTHHIDRKQAQLDEKDQKLAETNERLADLVIKLEVTSRSLADAISHQNDLHSQVTQLSSKNEEWIAETELLKNACQGSKDILERTEARLVDVAASLEEVEAERDSLILQLTNLQTDFNCAQQEVAEAESRYSHLQFHQLSSMSSNDVIQSLREQIRELEMRVLRRTEQIGIHQHDIKRLETNMRLQEERVGEMTVELEMLSEQKEAMVEDCADAREARDEAIQRVEALEEQLEALEGKLEILGEQRRNETTGLVGVVFQTIGHSRNAIMAAKAGAEVQIRQARQADETRIRARNDTSADEIRQTMLALAVCKLELSRSAVSLQSVYGAGADLQAQVDDLREQLGAKVAKITSLSEQLDTLQAQQLEAETLARDLLASHVRDFEVKSRDLQQTNENMKISHEETVRDLLQTQNDLHGRLAETEHMFTNDDLDNALEQLRTQHAKALANLEARLEYIANELNEARRSSADSERQHQQVLDLSVQSRKELETRLLAASDRLQAVEQLQNELTRMRTEHAKTVTHLQARLDSAIEEALTARNRLDGLQAEHQVTIDELARATQDYDHHLAQAAENLLSVQSQLDDSVQQVRQLDLKLREEGEDKETLKKDLYLTNVRHDQVASVQAELREELTTTKAQLDETRFVLEALQEEKGTLQIETTNLEAEIQRSISLHRFLESQVKDRYVPSITYHIFCQRRS
jgi:myosin protein heavy chain